MTPADLHGPTTHDSEADDRNENILIYVNGTLVRKHEAVVSVYDSGFMLGDGMWEGMRLYEGFWAFLTSIWIGCSIRSSRSPSIAK